MEQINEAAVQKKTGGARVQEGGGGGKLALAIAAAVLVAAAGGYAALCAYAQHTEAIWKGTQVLGQDIGGLSVEGAAAQVEQSLNRLGVDLYLYDGSLEAVPERGEAPDAAVPLADLPVTIDVPALVRDADRAAREGSFLSAGWRYLTHSHSAYAGSAETLRADKAALSDMAAGLAETLSDPVQNTEYQLEDSTLRITLARDGRTVDAGALEAQLEDGTAWCADLSLDVPYAVVPGETTTAQAIHDQVYGEMKNAGYDAATQSITPEQVGADFDVSAAQAAMDGGEPGETVSVPAQIQEPAVTAEALKAVLFRDVLGEARTHVGGTAARRSNVKLASSSFNGVVLNTGEVFSYNGTVGQRTTAKGYKAAPAYVQGETVDEIGGGVCQPSSTLYLACLRANLEITERYAHRYTPSYIEWGMDATVSWGGPDYKFTNNRDYPIKIVTTYKDNYLTVQILGTNVDGSYVKMTHEQISSTPFQVIYEDDPTLPAGTEKVKVTPYTGARVRSYRHVYAADGTLISSNFEATSDYKARNRVILRGPAAETPPEDPSAGVPTQGGGTIVVPQEPMDPTIPVVPQEPTADPVPEPPIPEPGIPIVVVPGLEG